MNTLILQTLIIVIGGAFIAALGLILCKYLFQFVTRFIK